MDHGALADRIIKAFDTMSGELEAGARYVVERPRDVALVSMREQARQAGVQPATMTRLAKHLGMDGYDRVRELYAAAVRDGDIGFAGKAGAQVASQKLKGDKALAADMLRSIGKQIERLAAPDPPHPPGPPAKPPPPPPPPLFPPIRPPHFSARP